MSTTAGGEADKVGAGRPTSRLVVVSQGDWGIVIGVVSGVLTVVFGVPVYRCRKMKPHWTQPTWTVAAQRHGTFRLPVLTIRWEVRGAGELQGVECAVQPPSGDWQVCSTPKGSISLPKSNMYTYVDLRNGRTFNTTIASPADIGKPVTDLTAEAVPGRCSLRIRWYEPHRPSRQRQTTFTHIVS